MCTREMDGAAVEFGTTGYTLEHVFVLYDRASDSVWYPSDDEALTAVSGAKQGERIPILDEPSPMPLGEWLDAHSDSTILLPSEADLLEFAELASRPYLGVMLGERDGGLFLDQVREEGPAAASGLLDGDRLLGLNEQSIDSRESFREALEGLVPGDVVDALVRRNGSELLITVTLGRRE